MTITKIWSFVQRGFFAFSDLFPIGVNTVLRDVFQWFQHIVTSSESMPWAHKFPLEAILDMFEDMTDGTALHLTSIIFAWTWLVFVLSGVYDGSFR